MGEGRKSIGKVVTSNTLIRWENMHVRETCIFDIPNANRLVAWSRRFISTDRLPLRQDQGLIIQSKNDAEAPPKR